MFWDLIRPELVDGSSVSDVGCGGGMVSTVIVSVAGSLPMSVSGVLKLSARSTWMA